MPTNSAVREMLPPKRLICAIRYSRSKISRASRNGKRHQVLGPAIGGQRHGAADFRRQHVGGDQAVGLAAGQDQQPLDVVAQLPDVARPVVRLQHGRRIVAELARRQPLRGRQLLDEIGDQFRDILAPLRQAWHP